MNNSVPLSLIERDASIQCRASIDVEVVNDYAANMSDGAKFPPVELFTDGKRFWIGDGWHRVMASEQIGAKDIEANVSEGGRIAALKFALHTNAVHGLRRTNADKRRCVEIAIREFGNMSSRAIAEMCGVSHHTVAAAMPTQVGNLPTSSTTSTVTGSDGKSYPAKRQPSPAAVKREAVEREEAEYAGKGTKETERKECKTEKQYKGSTQDLLRFQDIVIEIEKLVQEVNGLKIPNAQIVSVVLGLGKVQTLIASAIEKARVKK